MVLLLLVVQGHVITVTLNAVSTGTIIKELVEKFQEKRKKIGNRKDSNLDPPGQEANLGDVSSSGCTKTPPPLQTIEFILMTLIVEEMRP